MLFNAKRKFCLAFFAPSIEIFSEMKRIYLYFALMSAAVHASIAGTTLIETGFESPDDTKFFDLARFAANPSISESPEETIKGNASIIFDNMNTNARWPDTLILPKESLKKGKLYICSFKYKVLELGKGKRNHAFFEIKGADGKKKHGGLSRIRQRNRRNRPDKMLDKNFRRLPVGGFSDDILRRRAACNRRFQI